jgi:hypothetical protein
MAHAFRSLTIAAAAGAALLLPARAAAQQANDEVLLKDGTTQSGKVLAENYAGLELQGKNRSQQTYEWSKVASVKYGSPPAVYVEAEQALSGDPAAALAKFQPLAANEKLRDVLRQNSMYQVALLTQQTAGAPAAIPAWQELAKTFPSGRYLGAAAQGVVDGYLADGKAAEGGSALDALAREAQAAKAPDAFQAEVGVLRGRLLEAQGKFAEARAAYEAVGQQAGATPGVVAASQLGVGESLKREGKASEAEALFRQIVAADGSPRLLAGAWNGLADILKDQGVKKRDPDVLLEALFAYLRGVVQYAPLAGEPTEEHERALKGASECFNYIAQLEKDKDKDRQAVYEQRAKDELATLTKLYPNSKYIKQ